MARKLLQHHGLSWMGARAAYELQVRTGLHQRRFRQRPWADDELTRWLRPGVPADPTGYVAFRRQQAKRFFFRSGDRSGYAAALRTTLGEEGRDTLAAEADAIGQGRFRYFFSQAGDLGFPPDWHRNPLTGQRTSATAHWSRVPMFSSETGDLKFIWEPGRFASAYTLARAYWVTGNDACAELFWRLIESWAAANPPNHGAQWRCGQETSLRLMAWCFAYYACAESPSTTPDRVARLAGMVATQADRVAGDHLYATLQKNNHAISEGVGLWSVGLLFPELAMSTAWREQGRTILETEAERQIYDDGAYIQHSMNYHRLMLHDYTWAIRLGELNDRPLSPALSARVRRAWEFLYEVQDEVSGRTPNCGGNDGALILPLNGCDYRDFRPVLGATRYLLDRTRLYDPGPWDEDLIWLFGPEALDASRVAVERRALHATTGGYYTLRAADSWSMIRCAAFRDRPSQADGLHLDIWRKGTNLACDAGTYLYYAEPPWDNGLVSTLVHNTVAVDGMDQMTRGPRFLWLDWLEARVLHHLTPDRGSFGYFEGAHDGYHRLDRKITHRRAVLEASPDIWIVVDDLVGQGEHEYRLHWLLADLPFDVDAERWRLVLDTGEDRYGVSLHACLPGELASARFEVVRGTDARELRGWQSVYYGVRQPAVAAILTVRAAAPCRLVSVFAPATAETGVTVSDRRIRVSGVHGGEVVVQLSPPDAASIVQSAQLRSDRGQEHFTVGS